MGNPSIQPLENISKITTGLPEETSKTLVIVGYPDEEHAIPPPPPDHAGPVGPIVIRTEEVLIVVFVLILWACAIALFFNRWGKIRMLEPYQPKFHEEEHRPSCPLVELSNAGISQHRTSLSKYNVTPSSCLDQPTSLYQTLPPAHRSLLRSRQNSMFTGNSNVQLANGVCCPRKTRSAMDINSLIQHESPSTRQNSSILPISVADRRLSYAQHNPSALKDKRSCSLFPPGMHDRRRSCIGECNIMGLRDRYGYRDSLSPHLPHSWRRTSCAVGDSYLNPAVTAAKDRKPSFNNVLAQVTAERRPSSSMLRISNV